MNFHIDIVSLQGSIYSGEASEVILPSTEGEITVLSRHMPIVTTLTLGEVVVKTPTDTINLLIGKGVFSFSDGLGRLLVEDVRFSDEISEEKVLEAKKTAEELIKKGKVVGVISEKDLFYRLFPSQEEFYKNIEYYTNRNNLEKETRAIVKLKAKDLMTKDIISIGKNDHILTACSLLLIYEIRRLPVINHGKLVGVVTTNDIYKNFLLTITKK